MTALGCVTEVSFSFAMIALLNIILLLCTNQILPSIVPIAPTTLSLGPNGSMAAL
jgi:hypothetical protein